MKRYLFAVLVCLPLKYLKVNSGFGLRRHPLSGVTRYHCGMDLYARRDTVYAILDGEVLQSGINQSLGLQIRLAHGEVQTIYGHLSQSFVASGDSVLTGEPIGITGSTGSVTGEHLHFAVRFRGQYINPLLFLKKLL